MKLLEKLKNTFFEEEYIEVDEPEVKEQVVARKVETKRIEPKEIKRDVKEDNVEKKALPVLEKESLDYSDSKLTSKDNKLPYFEDEDFIETKVETTIQEQPKKIYGTTPDKLYASINYSSNTNSKPYSTSVKETFKPTPIISPIYGILDKNYHKDEVVDRKDKPASYVSRKNADLDSVRRKAYGEIDPIEEAYTSTNTFNDKNDDTMGEDNLLYDMTSNDSKPSVDKVTLADAEEYFQDLGLEYNIDYKDSRYEKATGRRINTQQSSIKGDDKQDTSDDANLEDNLFDLIDSMYEDGDK